MTKEIRLTKQEELVLGRKIQVMKELKENVDSEDFTKEDYRTIAEGEIALETLVSSYYNLARKIAHTHHKKTGTKYSIEDLLQDAISALVDSAYKYDPSKNCRLSTYAYYGITKRVSTTINYQRLVRLPENKMGEYIKISQAQTEYGELPIEEQEKWVSELAYVYANVGDLKREEVDLILSNMQPQVSLNADIYDGDGELMDLMVDEKAEQEVVSYGNLDSETLRILNNLSDYEKDLVAYEFGAFAPSMPYSEFQEQNELDDKKIKSETRKVVRKMRKIAEAVAV